MTSTQSAKTALTRLLAGSIRPVYALNEARRMVSCNPACERWLGCEAAALVGRRCDYHSGPPGGGAEAVLAGLCPAPEAFQGQRITGEVSYCNAAGQVRRRPAEFLPLPGERERACAVIVFVGEADVPEVTVSMEATNTPAACHQRLRALLSRLSPRLPVSQIVGGNPAILRLREQVRLAIAGSAPVLVVGPAGSGREYIARAIHYAAGDPHAAPLAPLACGLLDNELLETTVESFLASCAELEWQRLPVLLLLEVDQLSPDAQAVLMRLLAQSPPPLRILATARESLLELAADGFRRDLAYALSTLVLEVPPLAERPDDIPLLAQMFLEQTNAAGDKQLAGFTEDALQQLVDYPWPGNVDELAELVREACGAAPGPLVPASALPERIRLTAEAQAHAPRVAERIVLDEFLADIEKELLQRAVAQAKGNKAEAARLLGISRPRLLRRLEFFKLV
jgi:DNA-binding NtrC family response regulator